MSEHIICSGSAEVVASYYREAVVADARRILYPHGRAATILANEAAQQDIDGLPAWPPSEFLRDEDYEGDDE